MPAADPDRVFIIAEAGVNHNGSLAMARDLVRVAAAAGADAVKFQSFSADRLVLKDARKADYQIANTGSDDSQYEMLKALELSAADQAALRDAAAGFGIEFMSSPFDPESVDFLAGELGVARLKIPSGEIVNGLVLLRAWRSGLPLILSTGMCSMEEVLESLSLLAWAAATPDGVPASRAELAAVRARAGWTATLAGRVWLLQCVTQYPAPAEATNLRAMRALSEETGLTVGLSDHSEGWHVATAAVAAGAKVLEKHFTMSRDLPGPDHRASLEPDELARMVAEVREVEAAMGTCEKRPNEAELKNRTPARGSVVAARAVPAGQPLALDDLAVKRPGTGVSPYALWDLVGRPAGRGYRPDEQIEAADLGITDDREEFRRG